MKTLKTLFHIYSEAHIAAMMLFCAAVEFALSCLAGNASINDFCRFFAYVFALLAVAIWLYVLNDARKLRIISTPAWAQRLHYRLFVAGKHWNQ